LIRMNQKTNLKGNGIFLILLMLFLLMYSRGLIREEKQDVQYCYTDCNNNFFVRITGDIKEPGIYQFPEPVDLDELIKTGGGLKVRGRMNPPLMDLDLVSGAWVIVKQKENSWTFTRKEMSAFYKITLGIPIDIIRESIEGLTAIPGIGSSLAARIEEERNKKNGFRDLREIRSIPGIGKRLYEKIEKFITL
jgi:competence protein ComEA